MFRVGGVNPEFRFRIQALRGRRRTSKIQTLNVGARYETLS
jgi:hypothetical protein